MDRLKSRKLWLTILAMVVLGLIPMLAEPAVWRECVAGIVVLVVSYLAAQGYIDKAAVNLKTKK